MNRYRHDVMARQARVMAAADWVVRLRDPAITQADITQWVAWCEACPENKRAFDDMQALWHRSAELEERPIDPAALAADTYVGQVAVDDWHHGSNDTERIGAEQSPATDAHGAHSRRMPRALLAASVAVLAVIASGWWLSRSIDLDNRDIVIATPIGTNREVVLPDGTTVTVAGGSRVATNYSRDERRVFLDRGEAFFRVEKDRSRPFIVNALDARVTAVGTAFNVRAEQGIVRVAVTEGRVDVDRYRSPMIPSSTSRRASRADIESTLNIRLVAGHQLTLSEVDLDPIVVSVNVEQATAWMTGTLHFVDEPLSSVIAAVNRYARVPIAIESERLGALHFTGTVVADRVDEWLGGLPDVFPVVVSTQAPDRIVVRAPLARETVRERSAPGFRTD